MKWFKHETDSLSSEKLAKLIHEFGFEGYGRFWRIMELVAERMDGTPRCGVELPEKEWLRYLLIRRPLFRRYLVVIAQLFDIKVITTGLLINIEIPNLLKKRDNYTKDLQVTPKKLPSIEVEVEKKKIKKVKNEKKEDIEQNPPSGKKPPDPRVKSFIDYMSMSFKEKTSETMHIHHGKDGTIIKSLLQTYDLPKLQFLWDIFIASTDPFTVKAGFTIGVFQSQINRLISQPPPKSDWRNNPKGIKPQKTEA